MASHAGPPARRDSVPGRRAPDQGQGRTCAGRDMRNGQSSARRPGRRAGSDRHGLLHGGRGSPSIRPGGPLRAAGQVRAMRAGAARRGRIDYALELSDRDSGVEDVSGADPRQYGGAQALTGNSGRRGSVRQSSRGVRHAAGGCKSRPGAQSEARGVAGQP